MTGGIDVRRRSVLGFDLSARTHVKDYVTFYRHRAVFQDVALQIHGDHGAPRNHRVGPLPSFLRDCRGREESGTRRENAETANLPFHRNRSITLRLKEYQRLEESKGFGKRLRICKTSTLPFRLARTTGTSPQNSQTSCRQAPQGEVRASVSVTTAMASKPRSPSLMALKMAMRAAQTVRPYVAFSTLQPPKILPEAARSAAPTRKLEYGAWALSRACLAAPIRWSYSLTRWPPQFLGLRRGAAR